MIPSEWTLELLLLPLVGVLSAALYGIASLWAASGRGDWLCRVGPIVLLLVALVPTQAYELLAMFGMQAGLVVGVLTAGKVVHRRRSARRTGGDESADPTAREAAGWSIPRFSLRDVLKAILLCAAVAAICSYQSGYSTPSLGGPPGWQYYVFGGVGLALVTLAAIYLVGGGARWYLRVIASLVVALVGGFLQGTGEIGLLLGTVGLDVLPRAWSFVIAAAQLLLIASWLDLLRRAGWSWQRQRLDAPTRETEEDRQWSRASLIAARSMLVALTVAALLPLADLYLALIPPRDVPHVTLPDPNGYDELVDAANAMNWAAIPTRDFEAASVQACQTFVQDNTDSFRRVRETLDMPSQVPLDYSNVFSNFGQHDTLRDLFRALCARGKAAAGAGRSAEAMQSYLDAVRLADATSRGGLVTDELVAAAIEQSADFLPGLLVHLDDEALARLQTRLDEHRQSREPLSAVALREHLAHQITFGWAGRLESWVHGYDRFGDMRSGIRRRMDAALQLLATECVLLRYVHEHGAPPDSLEALVGRYLSEAPQDPYRDGPLVYRRTGNEYLLYSVGSNGVDDGGQRVSFHAATTEAQGDLFYDADRNVP